MQIQQPAAHLDQFMRQTRIHHVQLSAMADVKANMMLTAASLVLTFSVRYLTVPAFQWAALTLIICCVATITCAVYSTMPKLPFQGRRKPDTSSPAFNLLFFGSFADLEFEEYVEAMENVCNDPGKVYESMVREVYSLGTFLARKKYRYLSYAYVCFLTGILSSALVLAATQTAIALGYTPWHIDFPTLVLAVE